MRPHFVLLFFSILFLPPFVFKAGAQALTKKPSNNSFSAILVFGDSTVDPGNNNYIQTIFQSNFQPYGRDFPNHIPTGRFSNGRLVTDFVASYVGIKENVPAYLDQSLRIGELMTGVSFASAGSGFDPLTAQIVGAIPIPKQMEYFREYKNRLELAIGKQRAKTLINKAGVVISAGTNDFIVNYFGPPIRRQSYTVSSYQLFLLQNLQHFIKDLADEGARRIVIVGLPPMGCVPAVITLNSGDSRKRGCIESLSSVARDYNQLLQNHLKAMQQTSGPQIFYADIYSPMVDIIQRRKFGFDVVDRGCCGTGLLEASFSCNPKSPTCTDASKYAFWDAIHPTESTYYIIFKSLAPTIDFVLNA